MDLVRQAVSVLRRFSAAVGGRFLDLLPGEPDPVAEPVGDSQQQRRLGRRGRSRRALGVVSHRRPRPHRRGSSETMTLASSSPGVRSAMARSGSSVGARRPSTGSRRQVGGMRWVPVAVRPAVAS